MELLAPFGPCIGKLDIPLKCMELLNGYTEEIARGGLSPELNHGPRLVGAITQEITVREAFFEKEEFRGLAQFLDTAVSSYIRAASARIEGNPHRADTWHIRLCDWDAWIVRQFAGDYNPVHTHSNYHVSGVGYLKVPPDIARPHDRRDKNSKDGTLHFVHGASQFLCEGRFSVRPVEHALFLFPSYLMHTVYPFAGDEERRSFAFNVRAQIE